MDYHSNGISLKEREAETRLVNGHDQRWEEDSEVIKPCPSCCHIPSGLKKYLPPRGKAGQFLTRILACAVVYAALVSVINTDARPGGNVFSIYMILVAASLGGWLVDWKCGLFSMPPLLGMMIVGFMCSNIEAINLHKSIDRNWSSTLRSMALTVILLMSGIGLDMEAIKRLKWTCIRLSFTPCIIEGLTVAVAAKFILGMPWLFGLQLGFVLGAVTPAVVVPAMLDMQEAGLGTDEGVPSLIMAAASCDDVLAISLFGVFMGISFSSGNLIFNIFRGPIEIVLGLVAGLLFGAMLWYFPNKKAPGVTGIRTVLLLAFSLMLMFGSNLIGFGGAGALGVLTMAATACMGWGDKAKEPIDGVCGILWDVFQPLLFGLIGAEVKIGYLEKELIGKAMAVLAIGLILRCTATYIMVLGNGYNVKEKLFCVVTWLPKATVQAAVGAICLDNATKWVTDDADAKTAAMEYGKQILTIAVLAILLTAPLGAILISLLGPRWLKQSENVNKKDVNA